MNPIDFVIVAAVAAVAFLCFRHIWRTRGDGIAGGIVLFFDCLVDVRRNHG